MIAASPATANIVSPATSPASLRGLFGYFLRLGTAGFGGPVVLVERMRRGLQEDRRWIGASVIAIIGSSAWRLIRRTVARDRVLWGIVAVNALATAWTQREVVWLIGACGVVVLACSAAERSSAPGHV